MPDIKLLPKNFFKKNPLNPTSAYNIACYLLDPDFEEDMFNRLLDNEDETGDSSRLDQIDEEESQIILLFKTQIATILNIVAICVIILSL